MHCRKCNVENTESVANAWPGGCIVSSPNPSSQQCQQKARKPSSLASAAGLLNGEDHVAVAISDVSPAVFTLMAAAVPGDD